MGAQERFGLRCFGGLNTGLGPLIPVRFGLKLLEFTGLFARMHCVKLDLFKKTVIARTPLRLGMLAFARDFRAPDGWETLDKGKGEFMKKIIFGLVMLSSISTFAAVLDCDQLKQVIASQKESHLIKRAALEHQLATRNPWPAPNWDIVVNSQLSDEFIAIDTLEKAEVTLLEHCNP